MILKHLKAVTSSGLKICRNQRKFFLDVKRLFSNEDLLNSRSLFGIEVEFYSWDKEELSWELRILTDWKFQSLKENLSSDFDDHHGGVDDVGDLSVGQSTCFLKNVVPDHSRVDDTGIGIVVLSAKVSQKISVVSLLTSNFGEPEVKVNVAVTDHLVILGILAHQVINVLLQL